MGRTEISAGNSLESNEEMSNKGDWRRVLLGIFISLCSLAIIFYFIDLQRFIQAIRFADFRLLLLGISITISWLVIRGMVWRTLLQDKVPFKPVFWTLNEGYLLNNILPFRMGEVGRAFLLSAKTSLNFWEVLSSIVIERSLDVAFAVGLLFITLPFVVGANWASQAAIGVGIFILLLFLGLYFLARYRVRALHVFRKIGARWPFLLKLGGKAVPNFLNGLAVLTDTGRFIRAIGWMTLNWGVTIAQFYTVMNAFIPDPELLWAAFSVAVVALGIAAPSSPGAVGVLELSIVGSLALFNIDPAISLAFALSLHVIQYIVIGALGTYAFIKDGVSLMALYQRARHMSEDEPGEGSPM